MKTYLKVLFAADGGKPSQINDALANLGFEPTTGAYDWEYDWTGNTEIEDILEFADQIQAALKGTGCMYELETV